MARRRLVPRLYLAQLCGVGKQAITEAANRGSLREARAGHRGQKLDLDHPATIAYAKKHGAKISPPAQAESKPKKAAKKAARGRPKAKSSGKKKAKKAPKPGPKQGGKPAPDEHDPRIPVGMIPPGQTIDADRFADATLRQIARDYGTWDQFVAVVDVVRKLASIREKDDKHAEFERSVVPREFVVAHMTSALDRLFRRFVGQVPTNTIRDAAARLKAGDSVEDVEKMAIEINEKELGHIKADIARAIRKA